MTKEEARVHIAKIRLGEPVYYQDGAYLISGIEVAYWTRAASARSISLNSNDRYSSDMYTKNQKIACDGHISHKILELLESVK